MAEVRYMSERTSVRLLLDAIWNENLKSAKEALRLGANPSHRVNGYPLLIHAVHTRNIRMIRLLIAYGALQTNEALGYALEQGYSDVVAELLDLGIMPIKVKVSNIFGPYPCRQTAMRIPAMMVL